MTDLTVQNPDIVQDFKLPASPSINQLITTTFSYIFTYWVVMMYVTVCKGLMIMYLSHPAHNNWVHIPYNTVYHTMAIFKPVPSLLAICWPGLTDSRWLTCTHHMTVHLYGHTHTIVWRTSLWARLGWAFLGWAEPGPRGSSPRA